MISFSLIWLCLEMHLSRPADIYMCIKDLSICKVIQIECQFCNCSVSHDLSVCAGINCHMCYNNNFKYCKLSRFICLTVWSSLFMTLMLLNSFQMENPDGKRLFCHRLPVESYCKKLQLFSVNDLLRLTSFGQRQKKSNKCLSFTIEPLNPSFKSTWPLSGFAFNI